MAEIDRRGFLAAAAVLGGVRPALARGQTAPPADERRMTLDLTPGAVGIEVDQAGLVDLAARHGFESVAPLGHELEAMADADLEALRSAMAEREIAWGAAGLPVDFRGEQEDYQRTSQGLDRYAAALRRAGVTRVGTWLTPCSDTRTYRRYFDVVVERLRPVARTLAGEGVRLGLEYVGPKASWTRCRYPFVHTLAETQELVAAIGVPGVGYVLDSWHWFLAGDTVPQILSLAAADVVAVDLNDAPLGRTNDEQRDGERELPAATGVIPVADFLGALLRIGYDGPVRAEPFNAPLDALGNEEAAAAAIAALRAAFAKLG